MTLHEQLRELVAQRGPSVLESAEVFDWSPEAGPLLFSRHAGSQPYGDLLSRVVVSIREGGRDRLHVTALEGDGYTEPVALPELPGEPGVPAWGSR